MLHHIAGVPIHFTAGPFCLLRALTETGLRAADEAALRPVETDLRASEAALAAIGAGGALRPLLGCRGLQARDVDGLLAGSCLLNVDCCRDLKRKS